MRCASITFGPAAKAAPRFSRKTQRSACTLPLPHTERAHERKKRKEVSDTTTCPSSTLRAAAPLSIPVCSTQQAEREIDALCIATTPSDAKFFPSPFAHSLAPIPPIEHLLIDTLACASHIRHCPPPQRTPQKDNSQGPPRTRTHCSPPSTKGR